VSLLQEITSNFTKSLITQKHCNAYVFLRQLLLAVAISAIAELLVNITKY